MTLNLWEFRGAQYKMIGNAVPPIFANRIAKILNKVITKKLSNYLVKKLGWNELAYKDGIPGKRRATLFYFKRFKAFVPQIIKEDSQ